MNEEVEKVQERMDEVDREFEQLLADMKPSDPGQALLLRAGTLLDTAQAILDGLRETAMNEVTC